MKKFVQVLVTRDDHILLGRWCSGPLKSRISGCIGEIEDENISRGTVDMVKKLTGLQLPKDSLQHRALFHFVEIGQVDDAMTQTFGRRYAENQYFVDGNELPKNVFEDLRRSDASFLPSWYPLDGIPYDEMPEDDRIWYPRFLSGEKLTGEFVFNGPILVEHTLETMQDEDESSDRRVI